MNQWRKAASLSGWMRYAAALAVASAAVVSVALATTAAQAQAGAVAAPAPALPASAPASAASAGAAALPGPELFYRAPDIERAVLSPSGRWLAMSTGLGGERVGLVIFDLQAWKPLAQAARYEDADIRNFEWVNDERLVYTVSDRSAGGGDQRWAPGLFAVQRDGTDRRQLIKVQAHFVTERPRPGREPLDFNHQLLHVGDGSGNDVVVGQWSRRRDGDTPTLTPKRLDVYTGQTSSLALGSPDDAVDWLFDPKGEPRVVQSRREGRITVHWRGPADSVWRAIASFDALAAPFAPRFIDSAGTLYVTHPHPQTGSAVLSRFDFQTGRPAPEPLVSTPGFDFSGELVSETPGGPALGVRAETDAETTVWFDKRLAELQRQADARLPGHINRISCRRCTQDDMTALVHSWSDRDPGQIWVYTASSGVWRKVGDVRSKVDPRRMASTDFFRIRARDGLELPVWLTLPPGKAQPRAAVVLVHGGPWSRGRHWRWQPDAQFLASRGYAVIEPEFRGSTGYGQKHFKAGWRQWGQSMQDDVADALAWAIDKGHVDAKRVCIAGGSYGGYATLMGLVRHGEQYRCGAAWIAVTDPRLLFEWRRGADQSDEAREYDYPTLIGDPAKDAAMLQSVSPLAQAARIRAPLFLAMGTADRRVPIVHGHELRDALHAAGRPPTYVEYPDEGHGWFKLANRLDFARRLELFLAEHLR